MLKGYARIAGTILVIMGLLGFGALPRLSAGESFFHLAVGTLSSTWDSGNETRW